MTFLQLQEVLNSLSPEQLRQPARALNGKEFHIEGLLYGRDGQTNRVEVLISERKGA